MTTKSDLVFNSAFVLIDLFPLIKVTGMDWRKVEDVLELDNCSLLETNLFVLPLWS